MGNIKIFYAYRLRKITGKCSEELELKTPSSIHDLIDHLTHIYGPEFSEEIYLETLEFGERSNFYLIFVDGKKIPDLRKFEPLIKNKSEVTFLPLTGGG